jgi:hypothetical protein|tara:strand:- start:518 stop:979 length:462 start_codon:yes stop_codon:yes gene_type:complete
MNRIKVSFDTWIQLLGMVGVLGGLIFVGLEMRQTQTIALAAQANARTEMLLSRSLVIFEGRAELMHKVQTSRTEDLDEFERTAKNSLDSWSYALQANNYFQYQLGLLDDEQWKVIEQRIQVSWDTCEMRPLYTRDADTAFADYLATLKDNCDE